MKQLRYRDDSVKNSAYNPTLHIFCIMRKDVYLFYAIIPTLFPCLCFSTIPASRFVAKYFVHMRTSEENGIANETIVLEWLVSWDFKVVKKWWGRTLLSEKCCCFVWKWSWMSHVYVPRNLGICAISRLRCAFLESGNCAPISRLRTQSWDCAVRLRNLEIAQYACAISRLRVRNLRT